MLADPEKLERICLNLLFNALKFTAANGHVNFSALKTDGWLAIEVRDSGMGIPADQLPHIFNRFWQADTSSQRKFQGMGIGLALVKELAEVQGGGVSADSIVGKGTTMTVKLPYIVPVSNATLVSPAPPSVRLPMQMTGRPASTGIALAMRLRPAQRRHLASRQRTPSRNPGSPQATLFAMGVSAMCE